MANKLQFSTYYNVSCMVIWLIERKNMTRFLARNIDDMSLEENIIIGAHD